jgi:FAD/FMN-containing dehydrogenase
MTTRLLDLTTPDDPGYDAARAAWNTAVDQRPALVAEAASAGDVVEAVHLARAEGLRIAPQGTGHRAAALPALDGALLLRTSGLNDVAVDPARRTARIGAGAVWHDVIAAAAPHGLAAPHGFAGGVGVTGYLLGGGLGWLARSHGFGSTRVRAFDVVTVDGERMRVDARHAPDLFWALRGGGACGVIVTAIELELVELAEVYAGALIWPIEHAEAVTRAYLEWIRVVPDALTSSLRLMHVPGHAFVQLTLALQGSARAGDAYLAPLRAAAPVAQDTLARVPASALATIAGDPEGPMPAVGASVLLRELPPAGAFAALADPALAMLELRHLGGALRRQPGAIGGIAAPVLAFASAVTPSPALDALPAALAPWADPRGTLPTFAERPTAPAAAVREIAGRYDPERVLLGA